MQQFIRYISNSAKALELKMWSNGINYIIQLSGMPVNIHTGYATSGTDCEEEYTAENNINHFELCKNLYDAARVYEELKGRYME